MVSDRWVILPRGGDGDGGVGELESGTRDTMKQRRRQLATLLGRQQLIGYFGGEVTQTLGTRLA